MFGSKFRARKRSCQSFELKLFNPHHFHVLIVTIYRTFVLLNTLICPVGTLVLSIAKSLELKILVPKGKSDRCFVVLAASEIGVSQHPGLKSYLIGVWTGANNEASDRPLGLV